jgi:hypothetical protein
MANCDKNPKGRKILPRLARDAPFGGIQIYEERK